MNGLNSLPNEIMRIILSYLDLPDVMKLSSVSISWYRTSSDMDALWKRFWDQAGGSDVEYFESLPGDTDIMKTNCYWKKMLLRYMESKYRWRRIRAKQSCTYQSATPVPPAFDGTTLVICTEDGLCSVNRVPLTMRLETFSPIHIQAIEYPKSYRLRFIATNTTYIIAVFSHCILVYMKVKGKHYLVHYILHAVGDLLQCIDNESNQFGNLNFREITHPRVWCTPQNLLFVCAANVLHVWNLSKKKSELREMIPDLKMIHDRQRAFISSRKDIMVYDAVAKLLYKVQTSNPAISDFFINDKYLLIMQVDRQVYKFEAFDKFSGKFKFRTTYNPSMGNLANIPLLLPCKALEYFCTVRLCRGRFLVLFINTALPEDSSFSLFGFEQNYSIHCIGLPPNVSICIHKFIFSVKQVELRCSLDFKQPHGTKWPYYADKGVIVTCHEQQIFGD